eukprot:266236-Hanusia_phi.AAC.5
MNVRVNASEAGLLYLPLSSSSLTEKGSPIAANHKNVSSRLTGCDLTGALEAPGAMIIVIIATMLIVGELLLLIQTDASFQSSQCTFQDELSRLEYLLTVADNNVTAEPFATASLRFLHKFNCLHQSDTNSTCLPGCPPMDRTTLGTDQETIGCNFRYLRVKGIDVWGYGPSGRTWAYDLRGYPNEFLIQVFNSSLTCQGTYPWGPDFNQSVLLQPNTSFSRWFPDIAAWRLGYGTMSGVCTGYPCSSLADADPCTMLVIRTTKDSKSNALQSCITVIFVTFLLGFATFNFGQLTNKLVIVPLETMTAMVRGLMADPMARMNAETEIIDGDAETKSIAAALIKLSTMLQIAFGEAGSTIITENLNSGKDVNALIPGKRIQGVWGFCDIRSFTDCTECLQEDVMIFVNRVADFVHRSVSENEGAPNKNVGDAFQLAWRLPERRTVGQVVSTADAALRTVLRIVFETSTCPALLRLTSNEKLQARIPNYTITFGFGLHAGWAIEGAIGSALKIDPTYLSPNVKWSERLEAATKIYGVLVLMTDALWDLLSPPVQKLCRKVNPSPFALLSSLLPRTPSSSVTLCYVLSSASGTSLLLSAPFPLLLSDPSATSPSHSPALHPPDSQRRLTRSKFLIARHQSTSSPTTRPPSASTTTTCPSLVPPSLSLPPLLPARPLPPVSYWSLLLLPCLPTSSLTLWQNPLATTSGRRSLLSPQPIGADSSSARWSPTLRASGTWRRS